MRFLKKHKKVKTRFCAYLAESIDGRISLDSYTYPNWTSKEDWHFLQKELKKMDAVVCGRVTYEVAQERLDKRNTFVLTTKTSSIEKSGSVTFVNPKTVDLKNLFEGYKNVGIVGGARVYQEMLNKGMLDDLYVTIEPIVFGRGREAFFGGTENFRFTLESVKKMNKQGTVLLHYIRPNEN